MLKILLFISFAKKSLIASQSKIKLLKPKTLLIHSIDFKRGNIKLYYYKIVHKLNNIGKSNMKLRELEVRL